jgi:predicted DNA-binding transcriptional regulator YafY
VEIPPAQPDDILDFMVEGDRVEVFYHLNLAKPLNLSNRDVLALVLALEWAAQTQVIDAGMASSISRKIHMAHQGGEHGFNSGGVHVLAADDTPGREFIVPLANAIEESRCVQFVYFSQHKGQTSRRTVSPYRLYFREGVWYLRAYEEDGVSPGPGWRTFRLDRIHELQLGEEDFDPDSLPEIEEGEKLFVFEDGSKTRTRTRFFPRTARYIREMAPLKHIEECGNGELVLTYEVAGFPYFKSFVLQFGVDAEVLEPEHFRKAVADQLKRVLERVS